MNDFKVSRLLKFDSRFKDIPIIMLTSRENKRQEQLGIEEGADHYVYQSDDTGKLLRFINQHLKSSC